MLLSIDLFSLFLLLSRKFHEHFSAEKLWHSESHYYRFICSLQLTLFHLNFQQILLFRLKGKEKWFAFQKKEQKTIDVYEIAATTYLKIFDIDLIYMSETNIFPFIHIVEMCFSSTFNSLNGN